MDIRGKELHFLRMTLNWQLYQGCYTLKMLLNPPEHAQWSEEFIYNCEKKNFIRFEGDKIYVTDEAIRSINEKDKIERKLIEEYIIDDFEFAFLMFMDNRNEPVPLLDFPPIFEYHSKIDGKPVPGTTSSFYNWMDEIHKYITDPTIDGFVLNHTGKSRYAKLQKDRKLKEENELLDIEIKRQTIEVAKFSRNIAYASLTVAAITAFVPMYIWYKEKDRTQKTLTDIPQLNQLIQTQQETQQTLQLLQKKVFYLDTSKNDAKIKANQ